MFQIDVSTGGALKIGGTVWKMPDDNGSDRYSSNGEDLELVCHLRSEPSEEVAHISWLPSSDNGHKIMVLAGNKLSLHDISLVQGSDHDKYEHCKLFEGTTHTSNLTLVNFLTCFGLLASK